MKYKIMSMVFICLININIFADTPTFAVTPTQQSLSWKKIVSEIFFNPFFSPFEKTHSAIDSNNIMYFAKGSEVYKYNTSLESIGSASGYIQSIKIGNNNNPYIAMLNGNSATVKMYDGTDWTSIGPENFTPGWIQDISLALDGNNVPYVIFSDSNNNAKATVMKFDGTNWVVVGTAGFTPNYVAKTFITIDNNVPYVAYTNDQSTYVMKYNGTTWETVGSAVSNQYPYGGISIYFDANHTPSVIVSTGGDASVKEFDGNDWVLVSNPLNDFANQMSVAIDSANNPSLMFQKMFGPNIYRSSMVTLDNGVWNSISTSGFSDKYADGISLLIDNHDTLFATVGDSLYKSEISMKYSILEHTVAVCDINATTSNNDPITYSISDGDSGLFDINTSTGVITFKVAPDFENPQDSNKDNFYRVKVIADANGETNSIWVDVEVLDQGEITSNGGGSSATISVNENTSYVTTIEGGGILSISGDDKNSFYIDEEKSLLFRTAPNYEDQNYYEITVTSTGADQNDTQTLSININDIIESPKFEITPQWQCNNTGISDSYISSFSINNDTAYIAYSDASNSQKASVIKENGGNWTLVGLPGISNNSIYNISISFDINDVPYIAYSNSQDSVKKFDGADWVTVGSSSGNFSACQLVFDSRNKIYRGCDIDNATTTIDEFDGTDWVTIGNFSTYAPTMDGPMPDPSGQKISKLALDSSDNLYVVYSDKNYFNKATVAKYDGSIWSTLSAGFSNSDVYGYTSIVIDTNDHLYISHGNQVMTFDGTDWSNVGPNLGGGILSINDDKLYSERYGNYGDIVKFNGATWVTIASANDYELAFNSQNMLYLSNGRQVCKYISYFYFEHLENSRFIGNLIATDDDSNTLIYSISGVDSHLFDINSTIGALTFKNTPNYEDPQDSDTDNLYELNVTVSADGDSTTTMVQIDISDDVDTDNDTIENSLDDDDDNDGMPDDYEVQYSLNPIDDSDAALDDDDDGYSNLEEYQAGTNPQDKYDSPRTKISPSLILYLLN